MRLSWYLVLFPCSTNRLGTSIMAGLTTLFLLPWTPLFLPLLLLLMAGILTGRILTRVSRVVLLLFCSAKGRIY